MVSLWPWRGEDSSPAAFEKTLSNLSGRIGNASGSLESTRQRERRFRALWTLYATFAYLLYLMISGLVIGWQNLGATEYTAIFLGPVIIYSIRFALNTYYNYRTSKQQSYLLVLQKQRDETIAKLKETTKYNTTQQLLEKYEKSLHESVTKRKESSSGTQGSPSASEANGKGSFVPPATANVPKKSISNTKPDFPLVISQAQPQALFRPEESSATATLQLQRRGQAGLAPSADFAPNAFSEQRLYAPEKEGSKWYDRLLDVILGEDEASPKNRLVLICCKCRLVNGQAPPGVKTAEDVGMWKCSACGTMNGESLEVKQFIQDLTNKNDHWNRKEEVAGGDLVEVGENESKSSNDRSESEQARSSESAESA